MPSSGRLSRDDVTAYIAVTAYLKPADAAAYVGLTERHLRRLTASGQLPAFHLGRSRRYRTEDLDALMRPVVPGGES